VILCTDGLPNSGLGSADNEREAYYQQVGTFANNGSTTISIIGIEGADCGVKSLAVCADVTSGYVNVVNPLELQRQMRMIIDNPTLCTEVASYRHSS